MTAQPTPRPGLASIPAYVAGRPPTVRDGIESYKLSSNENPHSPPGQVLSAATAALEAMNRYPDMGAADLYTALAARFEVPEEQLALGTGSVALLYHLGQAFCEPGDEIIFAWRSFEAYPIAAAVVGAKAVQVPLTADGRHDLPAMAAAVTDRTKIILVCTPNNPTGPVVTHQEMLAFLDQVSPGVVVVIDQAYAEFVRAPDAVDAFGIAKGRPNVVVMRTFAKAYGLAGLRVGYLAAPEPIATAVKKCALPFGVSSVAQAAAVAALEHEADLMPGVEQIVAERARVLSRLRVQGWQVPDAQGNFVYLALGDKSADFATAAEAAGIMVRPYGSDGVRVTIAETAGNDIFLTVAEKFFGEFLAPPNPQN